MSSRLSARTLAGTALALFALGGTAVASGLVPVVNSSEGAASTKAQIIESMQGERAAVQRALDADSTLSIGTGAPGSGPGFVASDNVTFLENFREAADGVGARVVGDFLYVTTTKDLLIYDISTPTEPVRVGLTTVDVEFENEQVPTDGKILGISGQTSSVTTQDAPCRADFEAIRGCLLLFDVRDPASPTLVQSIRGAGDHTSSCLEFEGQTCAYMYGSSGSISDIRTALDEDAAPIVEEKTNWLDVVRAQMPDGKLSSRAHHQTEVRPGVLLTATVPITLISTNAEDGGSPLAPKLLSVASHATAPDDPARFNHSVEWPNDGRDGVMLAGGETNFEPTCGDGNGAFSTFTVDGADTNSPTFTYADQVRPKEGTYTDGNPPPGGFKLGCSVHWFEQRPDFADGGTVALASYENGTRFLDIGSDGAISEKGFFLPLDSSASAPHWASDGTTVYVIDYLRGLDVLTFDDGTFDPSAGEPEDEVDEEEEEEDEPDCKGKSKDKGKGKNCKSND